MKKIGVSLAAYRTMLERGGTVVCIVTTEIVAGLIAELDENEFVPSFRRSVGGTGARARSAPL